MAAVVAAIALWLALAGGDRSGAGGTVGGAQDGALAAAAPGASRPDPGSAAARPIGPSTGPAAVTRPGSASTSASRATTLPTAAELAPDGRPVGVLRGQVEVPAGVTFPDRWTLVLEPSRFVSGSEHAEARRVEIEGDKSFRVTELPLGGYDVYPTADGFTSRRAPVNLHPRRENVFVVLQMERAAFVDGRVLDVDGAVVEGLAMTLELASTRERRTTTTDHLGFYRFDSVADGEYRLLVGPPDAPVLDPRTLAVRPPSLAIPTIEVPALESLRIRVVDAIGAPVEGARVRGSGADGGYVDGVTDARGEILTPLLPPGRYRLRSAVDDVGRGFLAFQLQALGETQEAVIELRP